MKLYYSLKPNRGHYGTWTGEGPTLQDQIVGLIAFVTAICVSLACGSKIDTKFLIIGAVILPAILPMLRSALQTGSQNAVLASDPYGRLYLLPGKGYLTKDSTMLGAFLRKLENGGPLPLDAKEICGTYFILKIGRRYLICCRYSGERLGRLINVDDNYLYIEELIQEFEKRK